MLHPIFFHRGDGTPCVCVDCIARQGFKYVWKRRGEPELRRKSAPGEPAHPGNEPASVWETEAGSVKRLRAKLRAGRIARRRRFYWEES